LANAHDLAQASPDTTHATEAAHESSGMPQLDTTQWPGQMLWLVIVFSVFYLVLAKFFAPRLRKIISHRGATIAEDLANARANRDEAQAQAKLAEAEMAAAQANARKMAAEALAKSQAEVQASQAAEDERLGAKLAEAEAKIRSARDAAMHHVKDIATETAQAMIEKLTGKAANAAALKSALEQH
jgi:F-type H+-transporting ATPase subunit b